MSRGDVADIALAGKGKLRIEWTDRRMPVPATLGFKADLLTSEQNVYLNSWSEGT